MMASPDEIRKEISHPCYSPAISARTFPKDSLRFSIQRKATTRGELETKRRDFMKLGTAAVVTSAHGWNSNTTNNMASAAEAMPMDAAAFRAARRYAPLPFGKIAYIDRGSGDAALFLHGAPLNSFQWRGA